jgi:phosphate-selective porin
MKQALNYFITFTFVMGLAGSLRSQEIQEQPTDTLARAVQNIADELNKLKRLRISGYIQPQYQYIDSAGAPSVAAGDFVNGGSPYYSRFMMRRGRIKFTYEYKNVTFVLQPDITEKGLFMRETYLTVRDPWMNVASLTAGCLQVPFGWEVQYSSQHRETPERARVIQNLFPVERDLGAFLTLQAPKNSALDGIQINLAVMNGSAGVSSEFDNYKDYSARLQYGKTSKNEKFTFSLGASYYTGGYKLGTVKDYEIGTLANGQTGYLFATDTSNYNRIGERVYYGGDFQTSIDWIAGITTIRGEYVAGTQPGSSSGSRSLGALPTSNIYQRTFTGAYFYLVQNIAQTKFQLILKYDWYDPNTQVSGTDIGASGSGTRIGDIRFDTYGAGLLFKLNTHVKLVAYYDYVINESTRLAGYTQDIRDNVTTLRLQYRF